MNSTFDFSFLEAILNPLTTVSVTNRANLNQTSFSRIVTDSRQVKPGDFFVAVEGETMDGHQFIASAIAAGATGVLAQKTKCNPHELSDKGGAVFFLVNEPHKVIDAYRALALAWRKKFRIPILAVAGSVGKTTTKEFLSTLLEAEFTAVLKTQGSQNGFLGIPMTLLDLRSHHEIAVIEVGIDEPGAMTQHVELVRPDFAVMTKLGPEHLEKLENVQRVAKEESIFLKWAKSNQGVCIFNPDDALLREELQLTQPAQPLTEGHLRIELADGSTSQTLEYQMDNSATATRLCLSAPLHLDLICPIVGQHNASNLALALGAVVALFQKSSRSLDGLNERLKTALLKFSTAKGRTQIKNLGNGISVYGDFYNANPDSMAAALGTFQNESAPLLIACLADMKELGAEEEIFHRQLANLISPRINHVLLLGERMGWLAHELLRRGRSPFYFDPRKEADAHQAMGSALIEILKHDQTRPCMILLKGSRSMTLEKVLATLDKATQPG